MRTRHKSDGARSGGRTRVAVVTSLLLAMVAGPGCAVMTVDVDVYKGPLVNHRELQIQQTAGLAFAAKPLLGKLRYKLEEAAVDQVTGFRRMGLAVSVGLVGRSQHSE